ncbi:hypothetical protein protein [Bacillus cereus G9241]|nr:hypothetical protein protein [Bacillus cereus G9241]
MVFIYLRRAGVLKNKFCTVISVPFRLAVFSCFIMSPPLIIRCVPGASPVLVINSNSLTEAILGNASPRKPSVLMRNRSFSSLILLVACRSKATIQSSSAMPSPLSMMRIFDKPASSKWISIDVLFASIEFSTSSFTTEAGRSTTSPAAIKFESWSSSLRIFPIYLLILSLTFSVSDTVHSSLLKVSYQVNQFF